MVEGTMRMEVTIRRLASSEKVSLDAFDDPDLRRKIVGETAERKAKRMAAKGERLISKAKRALETFGKLGRIVLDVQRSKGVSLADAEVLVSTVEMLERRRNIVEEEMATQVQSKMRQGPRTCLFILGDSDRGVIKLLVSLAVGLQDVGLIFLCEKPGHEHFPSDYRYRLKSALTEERCEKLQPLLASGLQVVTRAMSVFVGEPPKLDRVTIPNLGRRKWDLRAIDLEKHGKPLEDKGNVEEMKRAEDSAAEWILDNLLTTNDNIYEVFGLLRVRYRVTEEGANPGYTRGAVAWLCADHFKRGLKSGILESYPPKYFNPESN